MRVVPEACPGFSQVLSRRTAPEPSMEQAGARTDGGASVAAQLFPDMVTGFCAAGAAPDAAAATPQQGAAGGGAPDGGTLRVLAPREPAPRRRQRPPPSEEELARAARLQACSIVGQTLLSRLNSYMQRLYI